MSVVGVSNLRGAQKRSTKLHFLWVVTMRHFQSPFSYGFCDFLQIYIKRWRKAEEFEVRHLRGIPDHRTSATVSEDTFLQLCTALHTQKKTWT